ncbi:MAG: bifunctional UDP-N-acetylmuramoyl-tripeptide:D-alanyl-D-alanine ligase/alanine racemase [Flavipsychrobacter sp.]
MATAQQGITIEQLLAWSHGQWLTFSNETPIEELVTDSRKINNPKHSLFIALKTHLRDGHVFVKDAYEKGVRNFMVSEDVDTSSFAVANFIKVKDTLDGLQQIAINVRKQYNIPVIGITGSNGKTIVKEWLYQLLSNEYNIVRSPKSYNSQVGVPLSVWLLNAQAELAIFEAGVSQPGEMERLERMISPTIGIFTNIGEAHSEGFLNMRQKTNEKLLLFRHAKQLIYCRDYPVLHECVVQYINQIKNHSSEQPINLFTWSQKHEADLRVNKLEKEHTGTIIHALYKGNNISITIPFTDPASIENAIHCWSLMILMNKDEQYIQDQMLLLQPVSMRLELRQGINDCTVINDTYNSDLTSLQIALDFLDQQRQHNHHTVILSDLLQIGIPDNELYEEVANSVSRRNIQRFIGIGPALYRNKAAFRKHKKLRSIFFKSTEDFLKNFYLLTFENEAILLKGARIFTFEKIGTLLEQKIHQTVLSINLSSLTHNLNVFRSHLNTGVKTMAMVKASAYGSGSSEIAQALQFSGVDYLTVAYTDEGIALRKAGITMPIMVMSPDDTSFDRMISWKLEPEIFNTRSLETFLHIAQTLNVKNYPIHIKLDTGMHRLGFMPGEINELKGRLSNNQYLQVASIFSHLAASDDPEKDDFTRQQGEIFELMSNELIEALSYKPLRHLCNSAAIVRHPSLQYDMVRIGLGLYGIDGSNQLKDQLKQIGSLKTTIAQIKTIPPHETIGYGRMAVAEKTMHIATICIGYADGYSRRLSNGKAYVLIHGKEAKIVGIIAMDMCMVDVTDIPEAQEGDEVIVFSPELPLEQIAIWADTIPYEVMTGISQRVKRVYVNEE